MKKLTQEVFNLPDCPEWAKSAAVDIDGYCAYFADTTEYLEAVKVCKTGIWIYKEGGNKRSDVQEVGRDFDATDWQNSAIDRDVTA